MTRGLLVLGFGGHARSVADVAMALGIKEFSFVDGNAREGESFMGFPVVQLWPELLPEGWQVFPAAGDNRLREQQCAQVQANEWPLATLVSPQATVGVGAQLGAGCLVAHHAHVGPMAKVGPGCIINTGAVVEHECVVGEFTHISVNAVVAGRSQIGRGCLIGAGATVIDSVVVGNNITVGAGGVVHRSIHQTGLYLGVPARLS